MCQRITLVFIWLLFSLALGLWALSNPLINALLTTPVVMIPYGFFTMVAILGAVVDDNV